MASSNMHSFGTHDYAYEVHYIDWAVGLAGAAPDADDAGASAIVAGAAEAPVAVRSPAMTLGDMGR